MSDLERVRADFDRIAALGAEGGAHARRFHDALLAHMPARVAAALDLGCGAGEFTRRLAQRADRVDGVDFSPGMIALARERSAGLPHVRYHLGDLMEWSGADGPYDVVATLATLHHLDLAAGLARAAELVRPGGVLLVLDLFRPRGPAGFVYNAFSWGLVVAIDVPARGWRLLDRRLAAAWDEHAARDRYLTPAEIRRIAGATLPGASVGIHLLWRWSLVWHRPR